MWCHEAEMLFAASREILSANLHSSALPAGPADEEGSTGDKSSICRSTNTPVLLLLPRQLRGGESTDCSQCPLLLHYSVCASGKPPAPKSAASCCSFQSCVFRTLPALQGWTASCSRALCCQDPLDGKALCLPFSPHLVSPRMELRFASFRAEGQLAQRSTHPSCCRQGRSSFDAAAVGKCCRVSGRWR